MYAHDFDMLIKEGSLDFEALPGFAGYILSEKLHEFAQLQLKLSRDIDIPMMKFLANMEERNLLQITLTRCEDFLLALSTNKAQTYLKDSVGQWMNNHLPMIGKEEIVVEDITRIGYIRKKIFMKFIGGYTDDINLVIAIGNELDRFALAFETQCFQMLLDVQNQKISSNVYLLEKINNTSPGITYLFDLRTMKEIYSNRKLFDVLGYTKSDINTMGERLLEQVIHWEDYESILDDLRGMQNAEDGEIRAFEYRVKHKAGTYKWIRTYTSVFKRDSDGKPEQIIGIGIDISEEKRNQSRIRQQEELLLEAQEIASIGSFEWDLVGDNTTFTPQLKKIFGLNGKSTLEEFIKFVHPSDRKLVNDALQKAFAGEDVYECEYRYILDGKEKIIWSRGVVTFEGGKPVCMKGTVMDVTNRHIMLKKLERSEQLHKQAQALTHIGNWSWMIQTNEITWSDEMYRIYGLEPQSEKITFERFISMVHPDDRQQRISQVEASLESLQYPEYVFRVIRPDGSMRVLHGKGEVLSENGKAYKLVGTCQDITKEFNLRRQLEDEKRAVQALNESLGQKNIELEISNKELSSFSYIASHDLQEPLRKIQTYSNRIIEKVGDKLPESVVDYLSRIQNASRRMKKLIEDLLSFSHTTSAVYTPESIDLNALVDEVRAMLQEKIDEKKAIIEAEPLPVVHAVPFQFQQLFVNLLSNSIKYSKPEVPPKIRIASDIVPGHIIGGQQGIYHDRQYHHIRVEDNGIGFDQNFSHKIFELFQRLHGRNEYSGTGIGLAICKKIIQNHQGFITAQGRPGEGSVFSIYLPCIHNRHVN